MAFNGVTKSASKVTKQDYMNLLYTDSDSDHVPDLKLPPVKGKKRRFVAFSFLLKLNVLIVHLFS